MDGTCRGAGLDATPGWEGLRRGGSPVERCRWAGEWRGVAPPYRSAFSASSSGVVGSSFPRCRNQRSVSRADSSKGRMV
jgi:hypothetical protein